MNGFDLGTVIAALEIMGKGMLGIFVTILIIMLCVMVMGKIGACGTRSCRRIPECTRRA